MEGKEKRHKQQEWESQVVIDRSFDSALNRLDGWFIEEGTAEQGPLIIKLCTSDFTYVTKEIRQAKAYHAEGSHEDAWFHLLNATRAISHEDGRLQGRFEEAQAVAARARAKKAGSVGGANKSRKQGEILAEIASKLLMRNEAKNFQSKEEFDREALSHGGMLGKGPDQVQWLSRLKRQSVLLKLIHELSQK